MSDNGISTVLLEYDGPAVKDGYISAEKMIQTVSGLTNAYNKLAAKRKISTAQLPELRLTVKSGTWELLGLIAIGVYGADKVGIFEFSRNFFGELGTQLALKLFAKNKDLKKEGTPIIRDGQMYVIVLNAEAEKKEIDAGSWEYFKNKVLDKEISQIVGPIEEEKITDLKYIYKTPKTEGQVYIDSDAKDFLNLPELPKVDLEEDFDESKAEKLPSLKGRLVSYNALASKYPFQFQPKSGQEGLGKFNVPVAVDEDNVNNFIELLKKAKDGNFIINGIGIRDESGLYKKIKITNVREEKDPELFDNEKY